MSAATRPPPRRAPWPARAGAVALALVLWAGVAPRAWAEAPPATAGATPGATTAAPDTAADPALEVRVNAVSAELRCLVCQNQTLADSHAPLAIDLKNQVREQLRAGRSADEVVDYMTARYGDFVRYRPPFKASTLLLWAGPALLLLGGVGLYWRALSRQSAGAAQPAALQPADQARADRLLD